ncbi:Beta-porphyranase B precursor [Planctomycetes bacterium CA13]|uniref:Beta-porphyranase B n=1 Tax=Novipirellula herctigrandis TaxID=2527986 RepID=A0A5C5YP68_9BACT|nr:Beta-porphyranase B precursor [Planctomycetes bacterium CA13]
MRKPLALLFFLLVTPCIAEPPQPTDGFEWKLDERFSDEFNGSELDRSKWLDHHPFWKGRPPAKFDPSTLSVSDGMLRIHNRMLDEPEGDYTIAGGAVVSKSNQAHYGYYEARLKASNISMSTTFWMSNRSAPYGDGEASQELDIVEAIGAPQRFPNWNRQWKPNTHFFYTVNGERKGYSQNDSVALDPPSGEAFHTYAAWWVDANTVHYYLDDVHCMTVQPSTEVSPKPFDRPMQINMVTETYKWETTPTPEAISNDEINSSYYDWVRVYQLVKKP